ncbi:transposase [Bernardetia sp. OM2101]|uniref:transposase n=1 Tax=Bernardetia sp. OM2101 TaxID=3344876 RepID=UPI0035D05C61
MNNPDGIYFITFSVVNWIDIFVRQRYKDIVVDSLKYCQENKGLEIFGWLSSHIHLIIRAKEDYNLSNILRDFKKFTSSRLIKSISDRDQPESRREWML